MLCATLLDFDRWKCVCDRVFDDRLCDNCVEAPLRLSLAEVNLPAAIALNLLSKVVRFLENAFEFADCYLPFAKRLPPLCSAIDYAYT